MKSLLSLEFLSVSQQTHSYPISALHLVNWLIVPKELKGFYVWNIKMDLKNHVLCLKTRPPINLYPWIMIKRLFDRSPTSTWESFCMSTNWKVSINSMALIILDTWMKNRAQYFASFCNGPSFFRRMFIIDHHSGRHDQNANLFLQHSQKIEFLFHIKCIFDNLH